MRPAKDDNETIIGTGLRDASSIHVQTIMMKSGCSTFWCLRDPYIFLPNRFGDIFGAVQLCKCCFCCYFLGDYICFKVIEILEFIRFNPSGYFK